MSVWEEKKQVCPHWKLNGLFYELLIIIIITVIIFCFMLQQSKHLQMFFQ